MLKKYNWLIIVALFVLIGSACSTIDRTDEGNPSPNTDVISHINTLVTSNQVPPY